MRQRHARAVNSSESEDPAAAARCRAAVRSGVGVRRVRLRLVVVRGSLSGTHRPGAQTSRHGASRVVAYPYRVGEPHDDPRSCGVWCVVNPSPPIWPAALTLRDLVALATTLLLFLFLPFI